MLQGLLLALQKLLPAHGHKRQELVAGLGMALDQNHLAREEVLERGVCRIRQALTVDQVKDVGHIQEPMDFYHNQ